MKKVEDAFEGRQVEGGAADAGAVSCPQRSGGARAPSLLAGKGRYSTRTKNSYSELLHGLRRHYHNLKGGSVRAQPPPRSPTHAHTHLTLTHGPAAPAAVNIFAFALLRVQVLVGDELSSWSKFFIFVRRERASWLLAVIEAARVVVTCGET